MAVDQLVDFIGNSVATGDDNVGKLQAEIATLCYVCCCISEAWRLAG
jgi:hypothetical protein